MKPTCALAAVAFAAGVVLSAGVVCAGDAVAEFESAYGAEYRRVVGTTSGVASESVVRHAICGLASYFSRF